MAEEKKRAVVETALLMLLFFAYAGDMPPMVNEAHYMVKAKNYWQPEFCQHDLLVASAKAHTTFYALFGWPTLIMSLPAATWLGRCVAWTMLALGLQRLCAVVNPKRFSCLIVAVVWIAGIEYCDLAGEWVVGGVEAKVPAYGLVLLGLSEALEAAFLCLFASFEKKLAPSDWYLGSALCDAAAAELAEA